MTQRLTGHAVIKERHFDNKKMLYRTIYMNRPGSSCLQSSKACYNNFLTNKNPYIFKIFKMVCYQISKTCITYIRMVLWYIVFAQI